MSLILSKKIYDINDVPKKTGIYYFIDTNNIPIYIGKSLDLNKRISQHLNSKSYKSDKIRLRFNHIRYLVTRCELIALLIESQEIKRNRPILNKKLRKKKRAIHIKKYEDENGYFGLKITKEIHKSITSFKSTKSAKSFIDYISHKFKLCKKIDSISKHEYCCFSISSKSKTQDCFCEEAVVDYNIRFDEMIKSLTLPNKSFAIINKKHGKPYPFVSVKSGVVEGYGFTQNKSLRDNRSQKKLDFVTKDEIIIVKNFYNKHQNHLELKITK